MREKLEVILVDDMSEVLDAALEKEPNEVPVPLGGTGTPANDTSRVSSHA